MPIFDPVARPGGYVYFNHDFPAMPRRKNSPTVDGGAVMTTHGYEKRRVLYGRFFHEDEIETVVQSFETDGFVRTGQPNIQPEVGIELGIYRFEVTFVRYQATP